MIGVDGFEEMYAADPDPFGVAGRWYERRKQAVVVASLARERYELVWDCASGTGHLALALLEQDRCEELVATDAAPTAVALSRELLAGRRRARCAVSALPAVPRQVASADLVLATEVLYYLADPERRAATEAIARMSGEVVAVHWRHHPHDAHRSGLEVTDELHEALTARGWELRTRHDDADFVLAGWVRAGERR